jgi:hypothetical protein
MADALPLLWPAARARLLAGQQEALAFGVGAAGRQILPDSTAALPGQATVIEPRGTNIREAALAA